MNQGKLIGGAAAVVVVLLIGYLAITQAFYSNDARDIAVLQGALNGTLYVDSQPGPGWRGGAGYHTYKKQDNYDFEARTATFEAEAATTDAKSIQVQFNDGGKARIGGNVQWEMPLDPATVIDLHTHYGSQANIEQTLIRNAVNRAMTLTAPLMSSTESYAARRSDFLQIFADQLVNGIYQMHSYDEMQPDPVTGEKKLVHMKSIVTDKDGLPVRAEESPLKKYHIQIQSPTIDKFLYESSVEQQIQTQRGNIMAIQTAQAEAKKAQQAKLTADANGETTATMAKWTQEALKAKAVTEAEQMRDVAKIKAEQEKSVAETAAQKDLNVSLLKTKQAEQYKIAQTLEGEGDAAKRTAVMAADGALGQKLDAWVRGQAMWAQAFAAYKGNVVPSVVTGGSGAAGGGNAAMDMMNLMGIKMAKDLALDMSVKTPEPAK